MASTNKTTNLSLSQFIATDKPSWLSDYNADMAKIDAGYATAISDSASAVSGAASASAAAQAAQATANSAETRSTNNATEIDNIKNGLAATAYNGTPTNNAKGTFIAVAAEYMAAFKFDIGWSGKPTNNTVSGSTTRIPIMTIPGNILSIEASTLAAPKTILLTTELLMYNTDSLISMPIAAIFDGANTIFYGALGTTLFEGITAMNRVCGTAVYFPTVLFFSDIDMENI